MTTISGIVRDSSGEPVAGSTVMAYRRDTGALLGSAVSSDGVTDPPDEYTQIATEGQNFTVAAGAKVRYGVDIRWNEKTFTSAGTYNCGNSEFGGDPASGTAKTCQLIFETPILAVGEYAINCASYTGDALVVCFAEDNSRNSQVLDWVTPE